MPIHLCLIRQTSLDVYKRQGKGRARPGWELLYNHYAKVKGMNAPYSQAFAEKERPEGYGERLSLIHISCLSPTIRYSPYLFRDRKIPRLV